MPENKGKRKKLLSKNTNLDDSLFLDFALICERIRSTPSKLKKVSVASEYFARLRDEDLRIAATLLSQRIFPTGSDVGEVNVGYSQVWNAVATLYDVEDRVISQHYLRHGDLGSTLEEILISRKEGILPTLDLSSDKLTLMEVYQGFQELAKATGRRSQSLKQKILRRLYSKCEPVEAKYLTRILTGEMRIGFVEGLVEESIAKSFQKPPEVIRNANLVLGDIGRTAVLAKDNALETVRLEPLRPTNFMLADTARDALDLCSKFGGSPVICEFKYDGIRAQVHKKQDKTKIFSRNLEDITRYFPEVELVAKQLPTNVILDGEIIAYDQSKPLPFQMLQLRLRKLEPSKSDAPVKYFAFDLLYLDENSLIDFPLEERVRLLRRLPLESPEAGFSQQKILSKVDEVKEMFELSRSLGYEGLVAKDKSSKYTPGRRGSSWVKLKRELDTLDVVIVAAEYGHGKRAGVLSDYTFAIRDKDELKVVGKAYSGLSDEEISQMTKRLKEITLEDFGYRRKVKPEIVLEVAFDAIQISQRHDGGFALRFPRIKRIRTDKSVFDIDTIEKVRKIYDSQKVKV